MASRETERNQLVNNFRLKFNEAMQAQGAPRWQSDEYHLTSFLMDKSTHFISHQVLYENIKDRLVPIFTRFDLEQAEAKAAGTGSIDAMLYICSCAKRSMFEEFVSFLEALAVDHFHAAEKLIEILEDLLATTRSSPPNSTPAAASLPAPRSHLPSFPGVRLHHGGSRPNVTSSSNVASGSDFIPGASFSSSVSQSSRRSVPVSDIVTSRQHDELSTSRGSNSVPRAHSQTGFRETLSPLSQPANHSAMTGSSSTSTLSHDPSISRTSTYSHQGPPAGYFAQQHTTNTRAQSEVYEMSTNPRGLALIINNENFDHWTTRQGSSVDVNKLYNMFKYLGFEVRTEPNKTGQEMKTILQKFSQHRSLATVSSLAVVILTHGGANDCLFGKNGQIRNGQPVPGTFITKMDIIHIFKGSVCRAMEGKPKLFILQACRGEEENSVGRGGEETGRPGSMRQDAGPEPVAQQPVVPASSGAFISSRHGARADTSDMCFVHSSSYGYKAYRTRQSGSPFIAIFTETVRQLAREEEFRDIVRKIQNHFNRGPLANNKMTLPDFSLQLMNKWFLNPPRWANTV